MPDSAMPPVLVLDLDGTLVDSAPDLIGALNTVLVAEGVKALPLEIGRNYVGQGVRALLERGFAASGVVLPAERMEALYPLFVTYYEAHIADETRPFRGALAALDRFAGAGWRLAVCSNKLEHLTRSLLDRLELTRRFAAITGGDTYGATKPNAKPVLATIAAAGGAPGRAVMVGDSAADIDGAKAAGIPVVAVDFGYTPVPVRELKPDAIISDFEALWGAAAKLLR
jgi:phosphoglycolate phosphatase